MKTTLRILATLLLAALVVPLSTSGAQTAARSIDQPYIHPAWTGVWQGTLDGVPSVTLTLADDAGEANGTIVFHAIKNDHGHAYSFSTEPHTLIQPRFSGTDGNTISFQVKRGNGFAEILNMVVTLGEDGVIQFKCSNCGPDGTKAALARMP